MELASPLRSHPIWNKIKKKKHLSKILSNGLVELRICGQRCGCDIMAQFELQPFFVEGWRYSPLASFEGKLHQHIRLLESMPPTQVNPYT